MTDANVDNSGDSKSTSLSLLQRVREREQEAWSFLVFLYAPIIYKRCRKRFDLGEQDAENVGQEVFKAIHRKVGDFDRQRTGSFRAWLNRIVDTKCIDFLRKKNPAPPVGGSEAREIIGNIALSESPEDSVEDNDERKSVLRQALKKIENEVSDRDMRIFWAVAAEERNKKTVAEEFDVSINVIYIVTSRLRDKLQKTFAELLDDSDFGQELASPGNDPEIDDD